MYYSKSEHKESIQMVSIYSQSLVARYNAELRCHMRATRNSGLTPSGFRLPEFPPSGNSLLPVTFHFGANTDRPTTRAHPCLGKEAPCLGSPGLRGSDPISDRFLRSILLFHRSRLTSTWLVLDIAVHLSWTGVSSGSPVFRI